MSNYVQMNDSSKAPGDFQYEGMNDPNLSQEERDLRLALALQQQENASVLAAHAQRQSSQRTTNDFRTARSGAKEGLTTIRKVQKQTSTSGHPFHSANSTYMAPGSDDADYKLAMEMQMAEDSAVGTARLVEKIIKDEVKEKEEKGLRSGRSMARH
jgi:hypothetical protein